MSKKSRRRNKKILAALALAGGAAMLGRGKGVAQGVSGADKAAFTSDAAYKLPSKAVVAADIAKDVVSPAAVTTGDSGYLSKMGGEGDKATQLANQIKRANYAKQARIDAVNTAEGPPSIDNPYRAPRQHLRFQSKGGRINAKGGGIAKRGTGAAYKKGGRVTGIAKRGFGRALMKGKK